MINYRKIVEELSKISDQFNDWELEFISSCYNWQGEDYTTAMQVKIIEMNNKYRKSN